MTTSSKVFGGGTNRPEFGRPQPPQQQPRVESPELSKIDNTLADLSEHIHNQLAKGSNSYEKLGVLKSAVKDFIEGDITIKDLKEILKEV